MSTKISDQTSADLAILNQVELFCGLESDEKIELARHFSVFDSFAEHTIIKESQEADAFFVIVTGAVAVFRDAIGQPVSLLARLGPGDFFGELGIFGQGQYSASVRTTEDSRLLRIQKHDLLRFLQTQNGILQQLQTAASQRHAANVAAALELGRRREVRIRCGNRIRLTSTEGEDLQVIVENMSVGGMCLTKVPDEWVVGEKQSFTMAIRESQLPLTAKVVWRKADAAGLCFTRRSANHDMILQMAIRLLLESAD